LARRGGDARSKARKRACAFLLICWLAPVAAVCQNASGPATPAVPLSQREVQLQSDLAQLNEASAQLQDAIDKAGTETLSLKAVHLSQEVRALAQRIEMELKAP